MNAQLAWHVARAAGLVAWALSTAAVIWGLLLSTRVAGRRPSPSWLADLHRYLGGLTVTFSAVHVAALLADTWVSFDVVDVLVPFASEWRPTAVAWGVVALYLLVAVEVTSLLRRHVPTRWWTVVHRSSFALFVAGTAHLLTAGTDAANPAVLLAVAAAVTVVVYLTSVRVLSPRRRRKRVARRAGPVVRRPTPARTRTGHLDADTPAATSSGNRSI